MTDSNRINPCKSYELYWSSILGKNLTIPMNQRNYSWEAFEIIKFLDDIIEIFEEGKYIEKMGSIISLTHNQSNHIYDGQQRTLTTIITLQVMGCLSEKLKIKINSLLTVDTDLDQLTPNQTELKEKYGVEIIPKIYCVNPDDMENLINIFNNRCETSYNCLSKKNNKIKNAFIEIYNYFTEEQEKYNEEKLIDLYKFILYNIEVQYFECSDSEYVSRIFDWENNRGKAVEALDIIKNPIIVKIADDKKFEVYDKWERLRNTENTIYKKKLGQKVFDIAIQLYNGEIKRKVNHEELYKPIIISHDTYREINNFFEIVEELFEIIKTISNDKFGRLLNEKSAVSLNMEAYIWCFLPIFYKINHVDTNLIKLFTKWYFRQIGRKLRGFNNLAYSNDFIRISNEVLKDPCFDYYEEIKTCLTNMKDDSISDENYPRTMKDITFNATNATYLLMFLETCMATDVHTVPLLYTLEHIYPQKNKDQLQNKDLLNNIGNLTLYEGKNSGNGHKGNSSLGAKPYQVKKISYEGSNCLITRNVCKNFERFEEEDIIKRNIEIVHLLNEHTNY